MLFTHARAILWAQMRSLINFYTRGHFGMLIFTLVMSAFWYGLLMFGGVTASMVTADPRQLPMLQRTGSSALFFMFLYWQVVPILMASTGAASTSNASPCTTVSRRELFTLEVLLRLTTGVDMLLISLARSWDC
jgi:ABC-2 type transport system permease protein